MGTGSTAGTDRRRTGGGVGTPGNRVLSCVTCRKRKILCNKDFPCANCIKYNIPCIPSIPAPSRPRRRVTQDMRERLAKCETLLQQYATGDGNSKSISAQDNTATSDSDIAPASSEATSETARRHIDGELWVTLNDEICKMKNILEKDQPEASFTEEYAFDDFSGSQSPRLTDCPTFDAIISFKLWQIYLERVNPLIKIIHAPTVQSLVVSVAADITTAPSDQQALVYSIFGLAISALRSDEIVSIMGAGKQRGDLLQGLLAGISVALARFGSLGRYSMVVLQALLHTSIILMGQCNKHAAWVLLGALVRIAMSMGYHRDGTHLSLPPFETEMRRRIWWQIVFYDIKLGIDSGLTNNSVPEHFDTKRPLNLNDADLFPDATDKLVHKEGPTEMAFVIIIARVSAYLLNKKARQAIEANILSHGGADDGSIDPSLLNHNRLLVQQLDADLLEIEKRFIPSAASNIHAAALGIRPHLIKRLNDMMYPLQESPDWGIDVLSPRDSLFKLILSSCENASNSYEPMDRWGFAWYVRLHFNFDILTSLATFLFHSPTNGMAHRGWAVLESLYARQSLLDTHRSNAAATPIQFILEAFGQRERVLAEMGQVVEIPELIATLRQMNQLPLRQMDQLHLAAPHVNPDSWSVFESTSGDLRLIEGAQGPAGFMQHAEGGEGEGETYEFWPGALWNAHWGQGFDESTLD
ncbi:unnamed protein product [Clonostachys rosea]|uniref:Zn(2)-C6 fungal-type domain-containing protein n=1 Tax=Bionectria ochroleuca TaxID=29856 RepID=A0ABY6V4I5_BIOOC|nr:unnamed protein product [Clonostachys rosea]